MSECCECVRVRVRPTKRFRTYWCGVWLETGALTIKSYRLVNEQILEIFNFLRGTTIQNIFIHIHKVYCNLLYAVYKEENQGQKAKKGREERTREDKGS